jgi:hypothetical protein
MRLKEVDGLRHDVSLGPPRKRQVTSVHVNSLHAMVFAVAQVDAALAVHGEGPGAVQLARQSPGAAPAAARYAFRREFLHAVIAIFNYVQLAVRAEGKIVRIFQLTRLLACLAPAADKVAVAVENLNAMIAGIGDV